MSKDQPRVFVGMSGGVDSSVAAYRLQRAGYEVVGVFIKVWHPDFLTCNWEEERLDAMRVAAHLNIPFLTCNAEKEYKDQVADYFINEYLLGRTPNPDVMCNKHVKFGAFIDFAKSEGADFIATGHYARRVDVGTEPRLRRGIDPAKDQSYFLWSLTEEQLKFTLLPIGDSIKDTVRNEAKTAGLPTALKKDSQGVCFLGHVDIKEFLSHYTKLVPGKVLNQRGEIVGTHDGALIYTIGQRHGLVINTKETTRTPYYVIGKDVTNNTVTVATERPILNQESDLQLSSVTLRHTVAIGEILTAQTRYHQPPFNVQILSYDPASQKMAIKPIMPSDQPAVGQSCVLYRDSWCLGGGIIS